MAALTSNIDNLAGFYKIATIKIPVPFRKPGNVIEHLFINFEVYESGTCYKAVPLCNQANRTLTTLPNYFYFEIRNGKTIVFKSRYKEIAEDIVSALANKKALIEP